MTMSTAITTTHPKPQTQTMTALIAIYGGLLCETGIRTGPQRFEKAPEPQQ